MKGLAKPVELKSPQAGWGFSLVPDWVGSTQVYIRITVPGGAGSRRRAEALSWAQGEAEKLGLRVSGAQWA